MNLQLLITLACTLLAVSACVVGPYDGGPRYYGGAPAYYSGGPGYHQDRDYGRRVWVR